MKISIITAVLNRKEFIRAAIESVLAQDYSDFEHWIIDGGSSDGTLELLKQYSHLRLLSEPDRGVFDAWNKGVDRATGELIGILNSDDVYPSGAFHSCTKLLEKFPAAQVVSGGCQIFRNGPGGVEIEMHRYQSPRRYRLSLRNTTVGLPIINSRFFRRSVFDQLGRFSLDYPVASDREFLIRAALAGIADVCSSEIYYRYRWHSGSNTMNAGNRTMLTGIEDGLEMIRKTREAHALGVADEEVLLKWKRELLATGVMVHAVMKERAKALSLAKESFLADPSWLFTFLRCGALATGRRVRTTLRTWRQSAKAK
ncbi:MAG TPA: glycosyltransferase [Chthoniobacterales bacterium]|nr:glycosyltransferase [Chthoniobacterales bacterium]